MMNHDLLRRAKRIVAECEYEFRLRLFECSVDSAKELLSIGLRHSVGLRKALEQLVGKS